MKKTHKKIVGFLGLLTVVAVTAVAVFMPAPETQATTSITDTITVKVANDVPDVKILDISNGEVVTEPEQPFTVAFSNVDTLTVKLKFIDLDGVETEYNFDELEPSYAEGEKSYVTPNYGYGTYIISTHGVGIEGAWDEDVVTFYYLPAYAELVKKDGNYYLDVYYNYDDGTDATGGEVANIIIKVYYPGTNEETPFSPITVPLGAGNHTRVELPFAQYGLDDGNYKIEVYSYGVDGEQLIDPYTFLVNYVDSDSESALAIPDTGGSFGGNNISQTDFLVTGLIAFGIAAIGGAVFILRSDKKQTATRVSASRAKTKKVTRRRK